MTKYFYTDPLAAAWMARHFGMRFTDKYSSCEIFYRPKKDIPAWDVSTNPGCRYSGDRLYIYHPSKFMIDPAVGDLLQASCSFGPLTYYIVVEEKFNGHGSQITLEEIKEDERGFVLEKIIQRNGIAFMWPERDE